MRLIDSSTYELREFYERQIPRYAILSHRWEEDGEVSYQDFQAGRGPQMKGWSKIEGCCKQALEDGWKYCWIDSCCIDKSSSAELSEAINSMFEWYRRAEVCYAYLSDVDSKMAYKPAIEQDFRVSAWFRRGWTLQELLAPQWVEFYDVNWREIGTKSSLASLIKTVTGISHLFNYADASIAQKMCWASLRQTTRVEDQAYCLLGIFGVHMPPLYGEGTNAFHRLQLAIISQSDDESIFAWEGRSNVVAGLLATSPRQFQFSGDISQLEFDLNRQPYSMTNQGLRLEVLLRETTGRLSLGAISTTSACKKTFVAPLNCAWGLEDSSQDPCYVGIPLYRDFLDTELPPYLDGEFPQSGLRRWYRQGKLERFDRSIEDDTISRTIYAEPLKTAPVFSRPQCVLIRLSSPGALQFTIHRRIDPRSDASWSADRSEGEILKSFYQSDEVGALIYQDDNSTFAVVIGSSGFMFWINIIVDPAVLRNLETPVDEFEVRDILTSQDRSKGGGDRIIKKLSDGRLVSAVSKKKLHSAEYRFVVDVAITEIEDTEPDDRTFSRFHLRAMDVS